MGIPYYVYFPEDSPREISGSERRPMGNHHDATRYSAIIRTILYFEAPARYAARRTMNRLPRFYKLFLGMLESCVAPILILIISMFYKKDEQVCRFATAPSDTD